MGHITHSARVSVTTHTLLKSLSSKQQVWPWADDLKGAFLKEGKSVHLKNEVWREEDSVVTESIAEQNDSNVMTLRREHMLYFPYEPLLWLCVPKNKCYNSHQQ